jgi:hypothetical protein
MATRKATILLAIPVSAALLAGCGDGGGQRTSELRPPAPALISAAVTDDGIILSPSRIGGGPVTLAVTNESEIRRRVTFASNSPAGTAGQEDAGAGQSASLAPGVNALLRANLEPGSSWSVTVDDETIDPQVLYVGPERPSSQNDLMLP